MQLSKPTRIYAIIIVIILICAFLGYTYYADADAIQHVIAEVDGINDIIPRVFNATLTFTLNVSNPTNRDINNLSSTFDIYIQQNKIGDGSFSGLSIPAQSHINKQVTITVYYTEIANSVIDILKNWGQDQDTPLTVKGTMTSRVLFGLATASHQYMATT